MKIHYCGNFTGKEYPKKESVEAVTLIIYKDISFILKFPGFYIPYMLIDILVSCITDYPFYIRFGIFLLTCAFVLPHEILHGVWFKEDSYIYRIPKQGFIITSTETLSRFHFLVMILFPSLVLGIVPIVLFLIHPEMKYLFAFGLFSLFGCIADFNTALAVMKQVPQKAMVFFSEGNTYFYIPD